MPRKPAHEQFDVLGTVRAQAFALFGRYGYEGVSIAFRAYGTADDLLKLARSL